MFSFDSKVATVRPFLLLGAAPHEQDYGLLQSLGVTHILQVGSELRPTFPDRFLYARVGIDDSEQEDIIRHLPRCFHFIDDARRSSGDGFAECTDCLAGCDGGIVSCFCGGTGVASQAVRPAGTAATNGGAHGSHGGGVVLVHCAAGMSRSATVVITYLMVSERLPYDVAFRDVKAARPCVYPNMGFLLQVWEWEAAGCDCERWPGWNKERFAERLAEYRSAQKAAGLHPAVRVRLPRTPSYVARISVTAAEGGGAAANDSEAAATKQGDVGSLAGPAAPAAVTSLKVDARA